MAIGARSRASRHRPSAWLCCAPARAWRFLFGAIRRALAHAASAASGLACVGLHARGMDDPIAAALRIARRDLDRRFAMRFSNAPSATRSTVSVEHPFQAPPTRSFARSKSAGRKAVQRAACAGNRSAALRSCNTKIFAIAEMEPQRGDATVRAIPGSGRVTSRLRSGGRIRE